MGSVPRFKARKIGNRLEPYRDILIQVLNGDHVIQLINSKGFFMEESLSIIPLTPADRPWVARFLEEHWGASVIVTRGRLYHADQLPGFYARLNEQVSGLIIHHIEDQQCEIISLDSLVERRGIGSALIQVVRETAAAQGCERLWLITTNDNTPALRFYQKRGFRLVALHRGAVDQSRKLKPSIPLIGIDGIEIHDEVELEMSI
jgi:GNAT superfamily N-acetyltransferase